MKKSSLLKTPSNSRRTLRPDTRPHFSQKTTQQNIQEIADTIKDLATTKPSHNDSLRLPPVNLPTYKGDPYRETRTIPGTSAISPRHYVAYLKQQCQQDIRAFDIIAAAEKEFTAKLLKDPEKVSPEEHQAYFDAVKNALLSQRGIPKEQQIRELLKEYYDMRQGASERVCDLAHRFLDVQTELAKLIPNIHYTSDGKDLELQYVFAIKLRSDLQAEIISREFKYADLQEIIQIAERYEKIHPPSNANWKPDALYSQSTANPKSKPLLSSLKTTACRYCKKDNHTSNNCFFQANKCHSTSSPITESQRNAFTSARNNYLQKIQHVSQGKL